MSVLKDVARVHDADKSHASSAMTRLSHFECLQLIGRSGFVDAEGAFTPDNSTLSEKQRELGEETLAVVSCLGGLVNRRLSRLLPFGSYVVLTPTKALNPSD